ncbi:succinate dehydrogenase / fumarate reductase cytochrome b subunit [Bradyrhizobium sp. USDA 4524]|uniref:succinate dehydrogenase, cytochrome b556 subunit n=1 Tax=unclassified Bradyrhizobium TaxID=2631580 RepID=UPI00209D2359|nr:MULTISPECIES: succinate dehydrogenase, cytochrome b556 subunit [unclassified Bradyrhizobium]MCP1845948.1 succinate dehydrogenase / fumarate reductase cytochrome b subunit [Bradyrhizobium sp. USDA 4538]MCP1907418.1 succinate dehydrogenase / fumarate reductase cytochrome b subunit [Bradyrhizobium sp. USDA 4537]MCP1985204.1 succinate dehydrogenase / fumarate reductase cytochrome b subunit [Bradyrhizobium sp. USDA 4539]
MNPKIERPLSPYTTIYRPPTAMKASITHRLTAIVMYFGGMPLLTWYLLSVAMGPNSYRQFESFAGSWFGTFVLFSLTWCVCQHLASGLRHLILDLGFGFENRTSRRSAIATFAFSLTMTVVLWTWTTLA